MSKHTKLFEVLSELIHVQIKKYVKFASRHTGPDGCLNASIIFDEVKELLKLQELLINEIETNFDEAVFLSVFDQVKFYMELESLRSTAEWFLSNNHMINNPANEHLANLRSIAELAEIDFTEKSEPATKVQQQCQHDSYEIAYRSLTSAKDKRTDDEIAPLYKECQDFLQSSQLEKRAVMLNKEAAIDSEMTHLMSWCDLVKRYQIIEPESRLFSHDYKWEEKTFYPPSPFTKYNLMLFGGFVLATGFISKMLPYFLQQDDKMPNNPSM
jgi:hypothetical protein